MDSPTKKQFFLGDEVPTSPEIDIIIDMSPDQTYTGPAALLADSPKGYDYNNGHKYCFTNDCLNGAITPESKNSSNASLISSNGIVKEMDFRTLHTIVEKAIPQKSDSPEHQSVHYNEVSISREEHLLTTSVQVFIAFIIAGFGNLGAGLILDNVQHWTVFVEISEMFVLVPSLLGLKGNLEMTMAARLSTHANLGNMNSWKQIVKLAKGNLALVQCQATVVSFLAAIIAIIWSIPNKGLNVDNCLTLLASSLITANVACFALGACMIGVIVFCDKIHIDPDNIATPIAASLGDATTAALLACFAQLIFNHTKESNGFPYISISIIIFFMSLLFLWLYIARENEYTRDVVTSGWYPVIAAMFISSCGGFILDYGVLYYERIALFQPIINGVGGNLVAVHASRISTSLHRYGKPGVLFPGFQAFTSPIQAFFTNKNINIKTSRILLLMAIPAHILYVVVIKLIDESDKMQLTVPFFIFYLFFALLQVSLLLYMAYNLVHILWLKEIDPDSYAIPLLTSSGDFMGSAFLLIAFKILSLIGDPNSMRPSDG